MEVPGGELGASVNWTASVPQGQGLQEIGECSLRATRRRPRRSATSRQVGVVLGDAGLLDPIFTHGGDTGDTLAALAYIAYRGGGQLRLTPRPGMVRDPFTQAKVERLRPLLERQPYIRGVSFGEPLGVNLDEWRQRMRGRLNLADYVSQAFDVPHYPRQALALLHRPQPGGPGGVPPQPQVSRQRRIVEEDHEEVQPRAVGLRGPAG